MSLCCYSAPCLCRLRDVNVELQRGLARLVAQQVQPTEVWMSEAVNQLLSGWSRRSTDQLVGLPVYRSDRLENELRISGPGLVGPYASLFIERAIYDGLSIDMGVDTTKLPIVLGAKHGKEQTGPHPRTGGRR